MKKGKLFIIPFLAMAIGTLSSCTKDDISALQEKDNDLQSQIDDLKNEVASLKSQITDLKTEMAAKIQEAKDDYGAKISDLQSQIDADKNALATLTSTYNTEKAALEAALRAEIKAVDDKYAPEIAALKAKDVELQAAIDALDDSSGAEATGLQNQITANKNKIETLESQCAADKAELQADYDAKIDALRTSLNSSVSSLNTAIDNLQNQINDLNTDLDAHVLELQNDYNSKINALTERVATLEEVVTHTVTFDVQGGGEITPIVVIHGDKVEQPEDPVKGGFVFEGWTYEDTNNAWLFFGYTVTEDLTLTANWKLDDTLTHDYSSNEEVLSAPTLQQDGVTRLHCGEEGHVDYKDVTTYVPYFYATSALHNYSYGTIISGNLAQGTLYDGDDICVQLKDGTLAHATIEELHDFTDSEVDSVSAGETFVLALGEQISHSNIASGAFVCADGEQYVTNWVSGSLYLLTKAEGGRHAPIFNDYRPSVTIGNTSTTVTVALPEDIDMLMPGQTADVTITLPVPMFVKNGTVLDLVEGSKTIGKLTVGSSIETVSISGNGYTFDTDAAYAPLYYTTNDVAYAKASDEFTLPTQNDFLASSIPLFRTLKGFAYDKDATNVDFKPGAVADLSKSDTLYAIWSIDPNTIFDFTDGSTFNYGVVSGKGMSVRADFINAGKTAIAVGDQVKVYYGTADNYQTITTEINGIEGYEGDDVTYYIGDSDGKEIVIYLNNIGDDVMSACLGVELVTVHDNLVISVATITGRGTLIEVKLSEDVEVGNTVDVLSNAYDGKVLNDTPIVSIYRDGAVIVNASAGETVGLLLRGVSKDDIPVGTMFWHDLP